MKECVCDGEQATESGMGGGGLGGASKRTTLVHIWFIPSSRWRRHYLYSFAFIFTSDSSWLHTPVTAALMLFRPCDAPYLALIKIDPAVAPGAHVWFYSIFWCGDLCLSSLCWTHRHQRCFFCVCAVNRRLDCFFFFLPFLFLSRWASGASTQGQRRLWPQSTSRGFRRTIRWEWRTSAGGFQDDAHTCTNKHSTNEDVEPTGWVRNNRGKKTKKTILIFFWLFSVKFNFLKKGNKVNIKQKGHVEPSLLLRSVLVLIVSTESTHTHTQLLLLLRFQPSWRSCAAITGGVWNGAQQHRRIHY